MIFCCCQESCRPTLIACREYPSHWDDPPPTVWGVRSTPTYTFRNFPKNNHTYGGYQDTIGLEDRQGHLLTPKKVKMKSSSSAHVREANISSRCMGFNWLSCEFFCVMGDMSVEPKIGGLNPPKWMVKIMKTPIKHGMIFGGSIIFENTHMVDGRNPLNHLRCIEPGRKYCG